MRSTVVVTGAAGGVGTALWPRLGVDHDLRLLDRMPVPEVPPGVELIQGDITDPPLLASVLDGADAVVHLAGDRRPVAPWDDLLEPNLSGVTRVLEAASASGVRRVVLASSCHASGLHDLEHTPRVDPRWPARPCCRYGVTKAYGELVGRYHAERTDLSVVALRLGAVGAVPYGPIGVPFWLSLDDLEQAVRCALVADVRHGVYYAGSANARDRWDLELGRREIGFWPVDDSADHLDSIDLTLGPPACYGPALQPLVN